MRKKTWKHMYTAGDRVEVRNMPWKGIIGTYVKPGRVAGISRVHVVEVGDILSGGTPRRIKVTRIRPVQEVEIGGTQE
jgi:hypothetical protein